MRLTILPQNIFAENNLKEFGENLHWARAEKGLSLSQSAQMLACTEIMIDELERGQIDIDCNLLKKITKLYNLKITLNTGDCND